MAAQASNLTAIDFDSASISTGTSPSRIRCIRKHQRGARVDQSASIAISVSYDSDARTLHYAVSGPSPIIMMLQNPPSATLAHSMVGR
jgi:hypothetical protein